PRYCPAGDGEFEEWVERCPECGRPLRDQPPGADAPLADDAVDVIVWLTTAPNEPIAQMWAEDLRRADIPVLLQAGGAGFGGWGSVATFEHQLYVRQRDLDRARAMMDELGGLGELEELDEDEPPPAR
nr:hypothetical protein [Chloroflexia bacterium]